MRRTLLFGLLAIGLGGCFGSSPSVGKAPLEPLLDEAHEVDTALGQRVRVVGEATNDACGATIVDGNLVVHMQEFRLWPRPIVGKRVEVVGRIEREAANGPRATASTSHVVIRQASYLLVD